MLLKKRISFSLAIEIVNTATKLHKMACDRCVMSQAFFPDFLLFPRTSRTFFSKLHPRIFSGYSQNAIPAYPR